MSEVETITLEEAQNRVLEIEAAAIKNYGSWAGFVAYAQAWRLPADQRAEYEQHRWLNWMIVRALGNIK